MERRGGGGESLSRCRGVRGRVESLYEGLQLNARRLGDERRREGQAVLWKTAVDGFILCCDGLEVLLAVERVLEGQLVAR